MDFSQTPGPFVALWITAAWFFVEGIALSRGVAWAYRLGIPLPWRRETLALTLPRESIDLDDRLDREGSFDTDDYCSAFYLDLDTVGLLYWAVSFGARNTLKIKTFRGVGVVATGLLQVRRSEGATELRWRPVLRVGPVASALAVSWLVVAQLGMHSPHQTFFLVVGAVYLGMLWWTLRKLSIIYDSVSAELVRRGTEALQPRR